MSIGDAQKIHKCIHCPLRSYMLTHTNQEVYKYRGMSSGIATQDVQQYKRKSIGKREMKQYWTIYTLGYANPEYIGDKLDCTLWSMLMKPYNLEHTMI